MTEYPIILVHGMAIREAWYIKAFGKIEKTLTDAGFDVSTAPTDGFGAIETNAEQLKSFVLGVLERTGAEKVNLIGHSKGGLDAKYMITELGMMDKVASFTTLCTPHRGSVIATRIWGMPMWIKRTLAFFINGFYRIIGDKKPDSMKVCEQLKIPENEVEYVSFADKIYCQSYSIRMKRKRDCIILALPFSMYNKEEPDNHDGLVSVESSKFENYRGDCLDDSVSHTQMVDFLAKRKTRKKILDFYVKLCSELSEMGY